MAYPNSSVLQQSPQTRLTNLLMTGQSIEPVLYSGRTTNATPTELFLSGQQGQRFQPPLDSVVLAQWSAIARIDVDSSATPHFVGRAAFSVIRHGTTLATVGANAFIDAATTGNPATQAVSGTAGHLAFTVDNTNDWMVLTVTGAAATNINWLVRLDSVICLPYPVPKWEGQF